jgi:hypothetical protein
MGFSGGGLGRRLLCRFACRWGFRHYLRWSPWVGRLQLPTCRDMLRSIPSSERTACPDVRSFREQQKLVACCHCGMIISESLSQWQLSQRQVDRRSRWGRQRGNGRILAFHPQRVDIAGCRSFATFNRAAFPDSEEPGRRRGRVPAINLLPVVMEHIRSPGPDIELRGSNPSRSAFFRRPWGPVTRVRVHLPLTDLPSCEIRSEGTGVPRGHQQCGVAIPRLVPEREATAPSGGTPSVR